jgi:hypothetical protein
LNFETMEEVQKVGEEEVEVQKVGEVVKRK